MASIVAGPGAYASGLLLAAQREGYLEAQMDPERERCP